MNNCQTVKKVSCKVQVVEHEVGEIIVTFTENKKLALDIWKNNDDLAEFGVDCGIIEAPENWNKTAQTLDYGWWEVDWNSITSCSSKYKKMAK